MDYHYNAFISYNHNERDMRIAANIHRKLENYRFPKGVKSSRGIKKIERVFRDKGELEVANDLNDIIMNALDHTDCLIVICSPESKASIWVRKEVAYFLETHARRDVLTVLTAGDPMDAIPDQLLYVEEEVPGQDGQIQKVRKAQEPLSCDYRGDMRKADREELPRLAAALFGCRYDDLVQRQRHYRMRRLMAFSAVAVISLALALSYFVWSNRRIRSNYRKALVNESRFLTNESRDILDTGDKREAVGRLLHALPDKEDPDVDKRNRPLYPEALNLLSEALNLYKDNVYNNGPFYLEVATVIRNKAYYNASLFTDPDYQYLFDVEKNKVYIYQTDSDELVCKISEGQEDYIDASADKVMTGHRIILCQKHRIIQYDYKNGEKVWDIPVANTICSAKCDGSDKPVLYVAADDLLLSVDTEDGSIIKRQKLKISTNKNTNESVDRILSVDERSGCVYYTTCCKPDDEDEFFRIKSVNLKTEDSYMIEDHLPVNVSAALAPSGAGGKGFILLYTLSLIDRDKDSHIVKAYDPGKKEIVWTRKYDYSSSAINRYGGQAYVYSIGTGEDVRETFAILPGMVYAIDPEKGEIKDTCPIESNPIYIEYSEKGTVVVSKLGDVYYKENKDSEYKLYPSVFPPEMQSVGLALDGNKRNYYCITKNAQIKKFAEPDKDDSYKLLGSDPNSNYTKDFLYGKGWTVIQGNADLICIDENDPKMRTTSVEKLYYNARKYSENASYKHEIHILEIDDGSLYYLDYIMKDYFPDLFALMKMDLASGNMSLQKTGRFQGDDKGLYNVKMHYNRENSTLYFMDSGTDDTTIVFSYNIKEDKARRLVLNTNRSLNISCSDISPDGKHILFYSEKDIKEYVFDLDSGSMTGQIDLSFFDREMLDSGFAKSHSNAYALSGHYLAAADGENIHVYDLKGKELCTISYTGYQTEEDKSAILLAFSPDEKYLYFYTGYSLCRCMPLSGKILNTVEMPELANDFSENPWWCREGSNTENDQEHFLYILNDSKLSQLYFNDDISGIIVSVGRVIACNPEENAFVRNYFEGSEYMIRYHKVYTPEEIIAIGKEELKGRGK